jgi:hypothetical protein
MRGELGYIQSRALVSKLQPRGKNEKHDNFLGRNVRLKKIFMYGIYTTVLLKTTKQRD